MLPILLHVRRDRDENVVIATLAEGFALFLTHADHAIFLAIDANELFQRIDASAHQVFQNVLANHSYVGGVLHVIFGDTAASHDFFVIDGHH